MYCTTGCKVSSVLGFVRFVLLGFVWFVLLGFVTCLGIALCLELPLFGFQLIACRLFSWSPLFCHLCSGFSSSPATLFLGRSFSATSAWVSAHRLLSFFLVATFTATLPDLPPNPPNRTRAEPIKHKQPII